MLDMKNLTVRQLPRNGDATKWEVTISDATGKFERKGLCMLSGCEEATARNGRETEAWRVVIDCARKLYAELQRDLHAQP
jgi:hypothetical protein